MSNIEANLLYGSYAMDAFGSKDLSNTKKGLTLALTITATYLSYFYLPPSMNKWVGGITVLSGVTYFLFGSFSEFLEYVSGLFNHPPKSGSANMWNGEEDKPLPSSLHMGTQASGARPVKKGSEHLPAPADSTQPSHTTTHATTIVTKDEPTQVHVESRASGVRPTKKKV